MKMIHATVLGMLVLMAAQARAAEGVVKTEFLACNPERLFERAERIRISEDPKALKAFATGSLISGSCVLLKAGTSVFTEGSGKGPRIIKVRPKGAIRTYFTSELAFQ